MAKDECRDAAHSLYHYLDGELTFERRTIIRQHLDDCPPCGDAFDFEAELRIVISQKCRDQVPDHLRLRVAEALRRATESPE
jgi:mycothiol system anti-sigma-R factor